MSNTVENSAEEYAGSAQRAIDQKKFFRWMAGALITFVLLISAPFTIGHAVATGCAWLAAVGDSMAHTLSQHPLATMVGAALSGFTLLATCAYQLVPEFRSLRVFLLMAITSFLCWLVLLAHSPDYSVLVKVFTAAGGTPPWLTLTAVVLLDLLAFSPLIIGTMGLVSFMAGIV